VIAIAFDNPGTILMAVFFLAIVALLWSLLRDVVRADR
jgi:hypothetical protein